MLHLEFFIKEVRLQPRNHNLGCGVLAACCYCDGRNKDSIFIAETQRRRERRDYSVSAHFASLRLCDLNTDNNSVKHNKIFFLWDASGQNKECR